MRLIQFLISGQNFFCPPPYYAVWNHPYLIILSAFSFFTKLKFCDFFSTKVLNEINIFFGRIVPKNQYNYDVFFWFLEIQTKHGRKQVFIIKITFSKNLTWRPTFHLKFQFWLDLKRAIFYNFFHKYLNYSKITILPVKLQNMKKIALGLI